MIQNIAPQMTLSASGLSVGYGAQPILADLEVEIAPGVVTTVIGPNGCGKSTLLRALARLLRPTSGAVTLGDRDLNRWGARELARTVGVLPQNPTAPPGLTVTELVARGRHPHQGLFARATRADADAVAAAMHRTDTADLADRPIESLSGGQRQRVWIALVLAQDTEILLLDEPTTFLDLAHAIDVLSLVRRLADDHGTTVVMVLHDLNLAVRHSDSLIVMRDGGIVTHGPPEEVITPQTLADAFDLSATVITDPVTGGPLIVPLAP
ncbi:ABC transporter ATP-binding protein [Williamsia sp. CHRR-6]|uniref:ABC transporter ATP-binding protein n=1 Tax=Williamsia sp. CHRR-6 TaxID=2835871 RepID=UPI001BDAF56B|nr:ABC transporter ATP-binding protein [Williamsia sp. CHRR-6]MBT0566175.1 ABC transporter ATP-binding protein [Williamsia sp. CHRR-6]